MSAERILVYDGDCSICVGATRTLNRLGLVPRENCRPFESLEPPWSDRLLDAGINNEMAAVDLKTEEIRSGLDAILWMLLDSWASPLSRMLSWPGVHGLARRAYHIVSYNRRIIVPAKPRPIPCACDPAFHLGYRLAFIVLGLISSTFLTLLLGARLAALESWPLAEVEPWTGALHMTAIAGLGWALLILASPTLGKVRGFDYVGHLVVTMNVGLAITFPVSLISLLSTAFWVCGLLWIALGISDLSMLTLQIRRVRAIGLSGGWALAWFLVLHLSAAGVVLLLRPAVSV